MWPMLIGGFAALVGYLQYPAPLRYGFSWSFGGAAVLLIAPLVVDIPEMLAPGYVLLFFLAAVAVLSILAIGFLRVRLTVTQCVTGLALFWDGLAFAFRTLAWAAAPYASL